MVPPSQIVYGCAVAFGIGMLMGLERERRKAERGGQAPGGIRTFSIAAVTGAVAMGAGGEFLLAAVTLCTGAIVAAAFLRSTDDGPGVTTEIALVLSVVLGGLAVRDPALASGIAVVVTVLLASRTVLHTFARERLSEAEVRDGLIFATAALVIWPLLPDRPLGPLEAFNLQSIWKVVVLVMGAGGIGYIATRVFGARFGLPFAGLASGFASSSAAIGAMGARATACPEVLGAAVAGAALSSVATFLQATALIAMIHPPSLPVLLPPLAGGGLAALAYGGVFTVLALKSETAPPAATGRPFDPRTAFLLAGAVAVALGLTAALNRVLGPAGASLAAAVTGFADAHAATTAITTLAAGGRIGADETVLPILAGLTANTGLKIVMAVLPGNRAFALRVIPGLLLTMAAAWAGLLLVRP